LSDKSVCERIIQAMPDLGETPIVEIGPGLGDLTKGLIRRAAVRAYEVDEDLYDRLQKAFKDEIKSGRLSLCLGDVLEFWQRGSLLDKSYFLAANIPYYITAPIICGALGDEHCVGMILMMQREVAEKLCASATSENYAALSVIAQILSEPKKLFDVPPEAFSPPPKVTSSVVLMIKRSPKFGDFEALMRYIKRAFAAPRKRLLKNLSSAYPSSSLAHAFDELHLDTNLRPHQLSAETHLRLFNKLGAI
jgi:16S rRNA (adenine1518-N6/adenine1519-N6)-dimethyltransferase